jgi:hypothetical protein
MAGIVPFGVISLRLNDDTAKRTANKPTADQLPRAGHGITLEEGTFQHGCSSWQLVSGASRQFKLSLALNRKATRSSPAPMCSDAAEAHDPNEVGALLLHYWICSLILLIINKHGVWNFCPS